MYCLRQLFCFVAFLSASVQTRRMWRVRQGSSLTWLSIRIRLQRRKPWESNKLFDLFFLPQNTIRPIRSIRGSKRTCPLAYCPPGRGSSVGLSWHTSSVGVPGYSWYCPPGSGVLCVTSCPLAYCPPGSSIECVYILAHLLRRCTRLLMVLPSRQQSGT